MNEDAGKALGDRLFVAEMKLAELRALCDDHERDARRWGRSPQPVPEWIPLVRSILDGHTP